MNYEIVMILAFRLNFCELLLGFKLTLNVFHFGCHIKEQKINKIDVIVTKTLNIIIVDKKKR